MFMNVYIFVELLTHNCYSLNNEYGSLMKHLYKHVISMATFPWIRFVFFLSSFKVSSTSSDFDL